MFTLLFSGIVKSCGEVATIKSKKDQRELIKRDLQLVDNSKKIISMTLWGKDVSPAGYL